MSESTPDLELQSTVMTATLDVTQASNEPGALDQSAAERGIVIGRYLVISKLGAGAMGVVFAAYDPELDRKVALKLLKHGGGDLGRARKRLQREAQSLAKLDHPNVVSVYDVGVHRGQLFVAMEFIEGETIGEWMARAESPRPWPEVLEVFMAAGRGLAAAHAVGMIHRDFKPDNMMLGADGRVRVMDFGLARADEDAGTPVEDSLEQMRAPVGKLTQTGAMLGTPAYMSFEQFEGAQIDARSDQFGFCASLYEALHGQRPYPGETLAELLRALQREAIRAPPPGTRVPRWLREVVVRGLAKDPSSRFASMDALLEALADDPVAKRRRWMLRGGLGLGLVAGVWGLGWLRTQLSEKEAALSEKEAAIAERDALLADETTARRQIETENRTRHRTLSKQQARVVDLLIPTNNERETLRLAVEAVGVFAQWDEEPPLEAAEALSRVLVDDAVLVGPDRDLIAHKNTVYAVAYSPDGQQFATASFDGTARLWSSTDASPVATLEGHEGYLSTLAYSPDGAHVATTGEDARVRIWSATDGALLHTFELGGMGVYLDHAPDGSLVIGARPHELQVRDAKDYGLRWSIVKPKGKIFAAVFSPDGAQLASADAATSIVQLWDAATGDRVGRLEGSSPSYSRDGSRLATSLDTTATVWDSETLEPLAPINNYAPIKRLAFSPDPHRLVTTGITGDAAVWDASTGERVRRLNGHSKQIWVMAFSPDGAHVATGSIDESIRIWDLETGQNLMTLEGHQHTVASLAYSPDGRQLVSGSYDRTAKLWSPDRNDQVVAVRGHDGFIYGLDVSPGGDHVATGSHDETARIWDAQTGEPLSTLEDHEGPILAIAYSPTGAQVTTVSEDGTARIWDAKTGDLVHLLEGHSGAISMVDYAPDGTKLVTGSNDKTARIWDPATGENTQIFEGHERELTSVDFGPNGERVLTSSYDGTTRLWDATTGDLMCDLHHGNTYVDNAFFVGHDGTRVVTAGADGSVQVWMSASCAQHRVLPGHEHPVRALAIAPDGAHIATGDDRGLVYMWDLETGERLATLDDHQNTIWTLEYSPDGTRLVSASADNTARIWDVSANRVVAVLEGHTREIADVRFFPDGERIVTASEDATAKIWDATSGALLVDLADRYQLARPDGSTVWPVPAAELLRAGCERLRAHEESYATVRELCEP